MVAIVQKWSLISLILFPLFLCSCASRQTQPDEEQELFYISEEEEIKFGNYVDAVVAHHYPTYKDETLTRKVAHIGSQVVSVSDRPDLTFTFKILNTSEVNAFAGPGGFVYVTIGLLDMLEKKDELAAVLAHEIGHVCERHSVRSYYNAQRMHSLLKLVDIAALVAGVPPIAQMGGDIIGDFSRIVANLTAMIIFQGYSRSWETSADELGFVYTSKTDYDPQALVNVLERFQQMEAEKGEEVTWTILSSHPSTEERIKHLKQLLNNKRGGDTEQRVDY